jgi:hypothetical protein
MLIFRMSKLYFYRIRYRHSVSGRAVHCRSQSVTKDVQNGVEKSFRCCRVCVGDGLFVKT